MSAHDTGQMVRLASDRPLEGMGALPEQLHQSPVSRNKFPPPGWPSTGISPGRTAGGRVEAGIAEAIDSNDLA